MMWNGVIKRIATSYCPYQFRTSFHYLNLVYSFLERLTLTPILSLKGEGAKNPSPLWGEGRVRGMKHLQRETHFMPGKAAVSGGGDAAVNKSVGFVIGNELGFTQEQNVLLFHGAGGINKP